MIQIPSPLQEIKHQCFEQHEITVYMKREDLIHPLYGGNKYRKMKYNIQKFQKGSFEKIVTFGGAYSNHIRSIAAICADLGIPCVGIIRGSWLTKSSSEMLSFADQQGMQLEFISKQDYRIKETDRFKQDVKTRYGNVLIIPEGGSNQEAVLGCQEVVEEIDIPFDVLCCAVGTGGTAAGLYRGIKENQKLLGFSVLKDGISLHETIKSLAYESINVSAQESLKQKDNALFFRRAVQLRGSLEVNLNYDFGGYAKVPFELKQFIISFKESTGILLDYVYNAKVWAGLFDLIKKEHFKRNTRIVVLNTGGLDNARLQF